ncbi:MAG: ferredoxin family protein [Anaerolineales bacterium]|nr:ferredoxin family protein [Anaerolineales bacterium]
MNDLAWLPQIDQLICTGCGDCVAVCPTRVLALVGGTALVVQPAACNYCAICEALCPVGAIALPYVIGFGAGARPAALGP